MSDQAQTKKTRSPLERAVVWGLIGILLLIVGIEGRARLTYSWTLTGLSTLVERAEQNDESVTLRQAREVFSGSPSESPQPAGRFEQTIQLSWFSILKEYRLDLQVEAGEDDPAVLGFTTPDALAETQELRPLEPSDSAEGQYFEMSSGDAGATGTPEEPSQGATPTADPVDAPPTDSFSEPAGTE